MKASILFLVLISTLSLCKTAQSKLATCTGNEECIIYTECDEFSKLSEKGHLTLVEREYVKSKTCKTVNNVLHLCCARRNVPTITVPRLSTTKFPTAPKCGNYVNDKIFGGEDTMIDEYPWIAQIMYSKPGKKIAKSTTFTGSYCGGSLINERFVLSAAHCDRKGPGSWKITAVRLGDWDTRTNPDCETLQNEVICNDPYVQVNVIEIIVHPEYDSASSTSQNDIMLLKLENDVQYTKWIQPICLPLDSSFRGMDFTKFSLEVAGFGITENGTDSDVKQRLDLDGVENNRCANYYHARYKAMITNKQICAGGEEGRDSCKGDSGGPLMRYGNFPNSNFPYYVLVGIVSYGPRFCGTKDAPGVYTRVSEFIDWINSNAN
ncbi:melanization protease 1-like isoform X1 [Chironomus tepperi]|uniref:melanization protease 1-like isoform X1 n=1 Tax=Chironomus tepperi TaxID=113505 RepID=UPI00391EFA9B